MTETTYGVRPREADFYYCATVEWLKSPGETDYLDGYALGDEPTEESFKAHCACKHSWVAGMMYVHDEDLDSVSKSRHVECESCDKVYSGDPKSSVNFRIIKFETQRIDLQEPY